MYAYGGGSSKSGVGNGIIAADLHDDGLEELCRWDTGLSLCTSVCVGRENSILVAVFGNIFRFCKLDGFEECSQTQKQIKPASENHVSDFKDIDPSINCCAFDCKFDDFLAIGGDDGVLRIWTVPREYGDSISCKLAKECTPGHVSPITDCSFSESGHLVVTASKDGTCQVWSVSTGAILCLVAMANDRPPLYSGNRSMVRACKFVGDDGLVSVQSAPRGHAFATRWILKISNDDEGTALSASLCVKRRISRYPVSAMCLEKEILAHGNVEGSVAFASSRTLVPLGHIMQPHELPVTALIVMVSHAVNGAQPCALSVSADYKIAAVPLMCTTASYSTICVFTLLVLLIVLHWGQKGTL
jgi:WD40 repeat protein